MGIDSIRENNRFIRILMWVKKNEHPLRETGLIFFMLALFMGVVWISGRDVEPIVFTLGSICTLLFTSPVIARYALPDRKPVRDMSYDEILSFVTATDAKLDWKWIKTHWAQEAFLKEDPRLRIRFRSDEAGMHDKDFSEPWVAAISGTTATSFWFDLYYDSGLIDRFSLVFVDGGKAKIPVPDASTLEVDPLDHKVAQIFDENNALEEYMSKAGLSVNKESVSNISRG
jgi:hypothetical protein